MPASGVAPRLPAEPDTSQLTLTDEEKAELLEHAGRLVRTSPALLDDAEWLAHARRSSCHLPGRLREAIRRYRHDPGGSGSLVIGNLPVGEESLPSTPTVPESVEREATVPSVVAMLLGLNLGEIIAYREEKLGALVQNVVPVRGQEKFQGNTGSVPLEFHVENAFHPQRPDFVGLLCLRSAPRGQGGTLVSSIREALPLLAADDRALLAQPRFVTSPPPSFHAGTATPSQPVLEGDPDDPNIRVDFNATRAVDAEAERALTELRSALETAARNVVLDPGQMVFVDNRLVLHGRSSFTPGYDGRDRWLQRVYVHLDNRRTRAMRERNGAVLVS